ncbi:O-antigen ligase family protein [Alcaligenaceae bacterium]|nr:O-antigen ligase family protein [Alcaligenaceae bacterium]
MHHTRADFKLLPFAVSFSVFLFFALLVSVPRGYTIGALLLFLCSVGFLARRPSLILNREDKLLVWLLFAVFFAGLLSFLFHGNPARSLDLPSRFLFAVPILLLLLHVRLKACWLWAGLIAGSISGAGLAFWQRYIAESKRAVGFTGVIQFGDLALMLAVFCSAGLIWTACTGRCRRYWQVALAAGALAGGFGSIASGTRGGWVAIPVIFLLFCIALINKRNIKRVAISATIVCAALATVATTVPTIEKRYHDTVSDIQNYQRGNADTSIGARFALWEAMLIMIPQKPLLGWSATDYKSELRRLVETEEADPVVLNLANTHNSYIELWVFQGLVGLLAVLALMAASFVGFCRRLRSVNRYVQALALSGATLVGAYSIFSMSQIMLGRNNTLLFFLVSLIILWAAMRHEERSSALSHS